MLYKSELLLATVLGRLPIWVILLAAISGKLDWRAFVCLYIVLLICRVYLAKHKHSELALPHLISRTLWKHYFRWIFHFLLFLMIAFGAIYAFISPDRLDFMLLLIAFGLYIPVLALSIIMPKPKRQCKGYLNRTVSLKLALLLLWCYVVFTNDFVAFKLMALLLIYTLEFLSIYKPEAKLNAEHA